MNREAIDIDALLATEMKRRRRPGFEVGWTSWVGHVQLPVAGDRKPTHPWCRGRSLLPGTTVWFPRTSKRPYEGERFAVRSPARQLPKLDREGWFFANGYVCKPSEFAPFIPPAEPCGVLPVSVVDDLHEKLRGFYDSRRR